MSQGSALFSKVQDGWSTIRALDSGPPALTWRELVSGVEGRHVLLNPIYVPVGVVLYLLLKAILIRTCKLAGTTGKSTTFRAFALLHNLLLCSYSVCTAVHVIPLTMNAMRNDGLEHAYCEHSLWEAGLGYWGFLFYLSKYWELVDTVLLIWKQRQPSYLQVYHHAMTIVCAYMLQASHASVMFLFVGLNASVHSIMYFYYALTVLGVRFGAKSLITSMQMAQFVFGIVTASPMFFLRGGACASEAQQIAVGAIILHAVYLTKLFADFYAATYKGKRKNL